MCIRDSVDCYEVARQLFAGELLDDVDPEHIVLFGDSAGGNLAASVSLLARELGEFTPRTQILLYPLVYNDHTLTRDVYKRQVRRSEAHELA